MFACCRIRKSTAFVFKHYLKSSILTWRLFVVSQSAQCFIVCRLGNAPSPMAVPISGQIRFQAPKSNILMFSSLKHMPGPCIKQSFSLYLRNLVFLYLSIHGCAELRNISIRGLRKRNFVFSSGHVMSYLFIIWRETFFLCKKISFNPIDFHIC